jgi:hypothetical protein
LTDFNTKQGGQETLPENYEFVKNANGEIERIEMVDMRNFQADFIRTMEKIWKEKGEDMVKKAVESNPLGALKVFQSMMPKETQLKTSDLLDIMEHVRKNQLKNVVATQQNDHLDVLESVNSSGKH